MNFEPCNPPLIDPLFLNTLQQILSSRFLQLDIPVPTPPSTTTSSSSSVPLATFPLPNDQSHSFLARSSLGGSAFQYLPPQEANQFQSSGYLASTFSHPKRNSDFIGEHHVSTTRPQGANRTSPPCSGILSRKTPSPRSSPYSRSTTERATTSSRQSSYSPTEPKSQHLSPSTDPRSQHLSPSTESRSQHLSPSTGSRSPSSSCESVSPPSKKRIADRHTISDYQSEIFRSWFTRHTYLSIENRAAVSRETGLPEKTVMYWFQNERRRVKKGVVRTNGRC